MARDPDDLQELQDAFLAYQKRRRHSDWTLRYYKANIEKFQWWCAHENDPPITHFSQITKAHLKSFVDYLANTSSRRFGSAHPRSQKPLATNGQLAICRAIRAFLGHSCEVELDLSPDRNPWRKIGLPEPEERPVEVLSQAQINTVLKTVDRIIKSPLVKQRTRCLLLLALDSGMRASELLSLTKDDVAEQDHQITIQGKRRRVRSVTLGDFIWAEVDLYLRLRAQIEDKIKACLKPGDKEPLWVQDDGSAASYDTLKNIMRRLQEASGVHVYLHAYRHTYGTMMRSRTDTIMLQKLMGHSNPSTTSKFYVDVGPQEVRAVGARHSIVDSMAEAGELSMPEKTAKLPPSVKVKRKRRERISLPAPDQLALEVAASSLRKTAARHGCTETTIRNRLKDYLRELPSEQA